MAQKRISEEFLDGIYEAYTLLMTDQIFLKLLDEDSTVTNVYQETSNKKYLPPIQLYGKLDAYREQGEEYVEGVNDLVQITIPTKGLLINGVDISPQNYETLQKGVISYKGIDYEIKRVVPRTNIDDVFQFYVFHCEKPKVRR